MQETDKRIVGGLNMVDSFYKSLGISQNISSILGKVKQDKESLVLSQFSFLTQLQGKKENDKGKNTKKAKSESSLCPLVELILKVDLLRLTEDITDFKNTGNLQNALNIIKSGLKKTLKGTLSYLFKCSSEYLISIEGLIHSFTVQLIYLTQKSKKIFGNTQILQVIHQITCFLFNFCYLDFLNTETMRQYLVELLVNLVTLDENKKEDINRRIAYLTQAVYNGYIKLSEQKTLKTKQDSFNFNQDKKFIDNMQIRSGGEVDLEMGFYSVSEMKIDILALLVSVLREIYDRSENIVIELKDSVHTILELLKTNLTSKELYTAQKGNQTYNNELARILYFFVKHSDYVGIVHNKRIIKEIFSNFTKIKENNPGLVLTTLKLLNREVQYNNLQSFTTHILSYNELFGSTVKMLHYICRPKLMNFQNLEDNKKINISLSNSKNTIFGIEILAYQRDILEKISLAYVKLIKSIIRKVIDEVVIENEITKNIVLLYKTIFGEVSYFHNVPKSLQKSLIELVNLFFNMKWLFNDNEVYSFKVSYLSFFNRLGFTMDLRMTESLKQDLRMADTTKLAKRESISNKESDSLAVSRNISTFTFEPKSGIAGEELSFSNFKPEEAGKKRVKKETVSSGQINDFTTPPLNNSIVPETQQAVGDTQEDKEVELLMEGFEFEEA